MLGLEEITDIIRVPDATIHEKCGECEELANELIKVKRETQRQVIAALRKSEAGAATSGTGVEEMYNKMNGGPVTRYGANDPRVWSVR
jgi:hypothetical protein